MLEEIHNLYSPLNIFKIKLRSMKWVGHVERMGSMENLVVKSEGKRPP
jgi:hypothetical protein